MSNPNTLHGIPRDYLEDVWASAAPIDKPRPDVAVHPIDSYIAENKKAMLGLEDLSPGICSRLNGTFGLYNFMRYPNEVMWNMDNGPIADEQYMLAVYARSDHNGALQLNRHVLSNLDKDLREDGVLNGLVVAEFGRRDVNQTVHNIQDRYGRHKAAALLISAHGGIDFERTFSKSAQEWTSLYVTPDDLYNLIDHPAPCTLDRLLDHDAPVLLNCCSEGLEDRVAYALSKTMGRLVTAATGEINIRHFTIDPLSTERKVDIHYTTTGSMQQHKVRWLHGMLVEKALIA